MSPEVSILIAIAALLGNAFFVGAEFALVAARRSSIELRALDGSRAAKVTLLAMEQVSLLLAGAQLGVTLCSLVFGAVGEALVAHALEAPLMTLGVPEYLLHPIAFVIALIAMVYVHVLIGEMVPKNLSLARSSGVALVLVPALYHMVRVTKPLIVALNATANACLRLVDITPRQEVRSSFTRDEVAGFIKESHREGLLSRDEARLLSGTLSLEERTIARIVVPLDAVERTSLKPTAQEVETLCARTGFSRFPVPAEDGDFRGYIHLKDVLQLADDAYARPLPGRLIRPLGSVKKSSSLRDALVTMQRSGSHIARVLDGKTTVGIVMLEDVLEELVGPINDSSQESTVA